MARRARHNINLIVERLRNDGYRFHSNDNARTPALPFVRATAGAGGTPIGFNARSVRYR